MCRMETSFIVTGKRRQDRSGAGHDRSLSFFEILLSHLGRFPRLTKFKETDAHLASSLQWLRHGSRVHSAGFNLKLPAHPSNGECRRRDRRTSQITLQSWDLEGSRSLNRCPTNANCRKESMKGLPPFETESALTAIRKNGVFWQVATLI